MGFIGVIRDVPAGSFELHGRCGDHLLYAPAALGALLDHLVGKLLNFFEAVTALLALIFVKWHGLNGNCEENLLNSILGVQVRLRQLKRETC